MTPADSVTIHLARDHAWVLGVIVVAGMWTLVTGAVWWCADIWRAVDQRFRTGRKTW